MKEKERKKRRLDHGEKSRRHGIIETSIESASQKRRWEKNDEKRKEKRMKGSRGFPGTMRLFYLRDIEIGNITPRGNKTA